MHNHLFGRHKISLNRFLLLSSAAVGFDFSQISHFQLTFIFITSSEIYIVLISMNGPTYICTKQMQPSVHLSAFISTDRSLFTSEFMFRDTVECILRIDKMPTQLDLFRKTSPNFLLIDQSMYSMIDFL